MAEPDDPSPPLLDVCTHLPSQALAHELAIKAVRLNLCAAANIVEIYSVYRWENKVHEGPEWRLSFKVGAETSVELMKWIQRHHPYTLAPIIAIPLGQVDQAYAEWIASNGNR